MKRLLVILTILLSPFTLYLSQVKAQGIDAKILSVQQKTYTSPFTETKVFPKLKKQTEKKGTLEWRSADYLRMDYAEPAGDYTLIEDVNFTVFQGGKAQKLPAKDATSKTGVLRLTLLYAFQGKVADIATLTNTVASYSEKNGRYVCELVAEQAKHGVKSLILEYDKKNGHLLLLTITESNGNYTTWEVK